MKKANRNDNIFPNKHLTLSYVEFQKSRSKKKKSDSSAEDAAIQNINMKERGNAECTK